jgi:carbonic anhydrase
MDRLINGYRRFRLDFWPAERARLEALAALGQRPETLVVSCSDSRVDPQTIFGATAGDLFVIRNIAGLVPPYEPDGGCHGTSAALEFGVRVLKVARVVVLGHAQCGGVQALVEGAPDEARDFVEPWMGMAKSALTPAVKQPAPRSRFADYEAGVIRLSLANLMTFPWVEEAVKNGSLNLYGCSFDISTGTLSRLDEEGRLVEVA